MEQRQGKCSSPPDLCDHVVLLDRVLGCVGRIFLSQHQPARSSTHQQELQEASMAAPAQHAPVLLLLQLHVVALPAVWLAAVLKAALVAEQLGLLEVREGLLAGS